MQHIESLADVHLENAWVTIGSFDGVHRGHQEIIRQLTAGARQANAPAVVVTFYPHPSVVLGKRQDPFYLSSPEEKAELLGQLGVDYVITHPFNKDVAGMTASEFMTRLSVHLGLSHLCIGYDFALGRGREGDENRLRELGQELGYMLSVMKPVILDGEPVSSSAIRTALAYGDVDQAEKFLGRPYELKGEIVHGDGRGHNLGIPTANIDFWSERMIPKPGVYVCQAEVDGSEWAAVTNVGYRPTFPDTPPVPRVEAHLLDFSQSLYGQQMRLAFLHRLRDEQRFPGIDALVEQIHRDIQATRDFFAR